MIRLWLPVIVALVPMISGCTTERVATPLIDASTDRTGTRLLVTVGSCGGNPEVVEVDEAATQVRVLVVSDEAKGDTLACAEAVQVRLQKPLADRALIESTGDDVEVSR